MDASRVWGVVKQVFNVSLFDGLVIFPNVSFLRLQQLLRPIVVLLRHSGLVLNQFLQGEVEELLRLASSQVLLHLHFPTHLPCLGKVSLLFDLSSVLLLYENVLSQDVVSKHAIRASWLLILQHGGVGCRVWELHGTHVWFDRLKYVCERASQIRVKLLKVLAIFQRVLAPNSFVSSHFCCEVLSKLVCTSPNNLAEV